MAEGHLGSEQQGAGSLFRAESPPSPTKTQLFWASLSQVPHWRGHLESALPSLKVTCYLPPWGQSHLPVVSGQVWLQAPSGTLPSLQESASQKNFVLSFLATLLPRLNWVYNPFVALSLLFMCWVSVKFYVLGQLLHATWTNFQKYKPVSQVPLRGRDRAVLLKLSLSYSKSYFLFLPMYSSRNLTHV